MSNLRLILLLGAALITACGDGTGPGLISEQQVLGTWRLRPASSGCGSGVQVTVNSAVGTGDVFGVLTGNWQSFRLSDGALTGSPGGFTGSMSRRATEGDFRMVLRVSNPRMEMNGVLRTDGTARAIADWTTAACSEMTGQKVVS